MIGQIWEDFHRGGGKPEQGTQMPAEWKVNQSNFSCFRRGKQGLERERGLPKVRDMFQTLMKSREVWEENPRLLWRETRKQAQREEGNYVPRFRAKVSCLHSSCFHPCPCQLASGTTRSSIHSIYQPGRQRSCHSVKKLREVRRTCLFLNEKLWKRLDTFGHCSPQEASLLTPRLNGHVNLAHTVGGPQNRDGHVSQPMPVVPASVLLALSSTLKSVPV
ncbi:uncharacterized protein LOC102724877 isoform X2 [Homo sapiens]|uniref:uncharacterized protein LOC102724877 isoform X2 n=1 Tax=Homo sapiens TaxID=9606 RepID=UPI0005D0360E|nr:uncharacterized protein LOC102724877 isoform X2 [Homo sapiens]XP_047300105.1 uncharacterized protein LOC102724877 isoform X2 [Homo sapiens]|eukprot:XP_011511655.1 uncharacterized protein LOC102724877 isoform X2 [Homo sapiens]